MPYGRPVTLRVVVAVYPLILFATISSNNKRLTNGKGDDSCRAIYPRPEEAEFFAHRDKTIETIDNF